MHNPQSAFPNPFDPPKDYPITGTSSEYVVTEDQFVSGMKLIWFHGFWKKALSCLVAAVIFGGCLSFLTRKDLMAFDRWPLLVLLLIISLWLCIIILECTVETPKHARKTFRKSRCHNGLHQIHEIDGGYIIENEWSRNKSLWVDIEKIIWGKDVAVIVNKAYGLQIVSITEKSILDLLKKFEMNAKRLV